MSALQDDVLAALPGTMQEISARVGVSGQPLWDVMHTLRKAGVILRSPAVGNRGTSSRVFSRAPEPEKPAGLNPQYAEKHEKRTRRRPVILFWLPGWPAQNPNQRMVWRIVWFGMPAAERELDGLRKRLGDVANWEVVLLSPTEARRLRAQGYSLREELERRRREAEAAVES